MFFILQTGKCFSNILYFCETEIMFYMWKVFYTHEVKNIPAVCSISLKQMKWKLL